MVYNSGEKVRKACRNKSLTKQTSGLAPGFVQANLVILPKDWAWDFIVFAQRNPKPCPILEVGELGDYTTKFLAKSADIRTDLPKYRVFKNGKMEDEVTDLINLWQDDYIYFLIGCSFSFEEALLYSGLEIRHITQNRNVPMYKTNIICSAAGRFKETPMVVSMRPFKTTDVIKAVTITREFPGVHGAPVHIGNPEIIGIEDINRPDWGDSVTIDKDEVPLFWACGVTPQMAATVAAPPIMITHSPGHMFVGDLKNYEFKI